MASAIIIDALWTQPATHKPPRQLTSSQYNKDV